MAGLSSNGEAVVLSALLTGAYISLHTADPGNTGANEASGGSYARVGPIAWTSAGNNPTVYSNSAIVDFPTATAGWGVVTHFGVWSALAGIFLGSQPLDTARTVALGDQPRFLTGTLQVSAN